MNKTQVELAAEKLVAARTSKSADSAVETSALDFAPEDLDDVYAIQQAVAARLGSIGGWKTSAETADSVPVGAPVFSTDIVQSGTTLACDDFRLTAVEAELAFCMGQDMAARDTAYTEAEFLDAVAYMLPLIEIVDSRLTDFEAAGDLWKLADNQINAGFVLGAPIPGWQSLDFNKLGIALELDSRPFKQARGWNFPGTPAGLSTRFVNRFAGHCGGIKAGQIITTGSMTGIDFIDIPAHFVARFDNMPGISVSFA